MICRTLIKAHLLLSVSYKRFGGKQVGYTVTLMLTLLLWFNFVSILFLLAYAQIIDLPEYPSKGGILTIMAGMILLIHTLLGERWVYINESRKYLRALGRKRKMLYSSLMLAWYVLTFVAIFPFSWGLYLFG